jgi:antitoxin CptB
MDLVVGGFARAHISELNERELAELEAIINIPDQDLMAWIIGKVEIPARHRSATLTRLLAYRP